MMHEDSYRSPIICREVQGMSGKFLFDVSSVSQLFQGRSEASHAATVSARTRVGATHVVLGTCV